MHVSHKAARSLAALGLAAALGIPHPVAAQVPATGAPVQAAPDTQMQLSAYALSQVAALQAEKAARTPTQTKIESNLLRAALIARAATAAPTAASPLRGRAAAGATGVGALKAATLSLLNTIPISDEAQPDSNGMVSVDIEATVTNDLLARISAAGGTIVGSWPAYDSVRASLPVVQLETVATSPAVRSIRPAEVAHLVGYRATPRPANAGRPGPLVPGLPALAPAPPRPSIATTPAARRWRAKAALPALLDRALRVQAAGAGGSSNGKGSPMLWLAATPAATTADPEGDLAQRAGLARATFGVDGTGIKIGVISDTVKGLASEQAAGRVGPVTVLSGASGGTGEGTAMLEIIYRLAPGAQLYFATANGGQAAFASNIRALQQAGCNVIVDDVGYAAEPPFQDGVINQAIDAVSAAGAFYFSAAGNDYNLDQEGATATWEGDWRASSTVLPSVSGTTKDAGLSTLAFDAANDYGDQAVANGTQSTYLFWADPQGGATDDYDIYVFNSGFTAVTYSSTNTQNGTQNPIESCTTKNGQQIVIVKASGNGVFLHMYLTSDGAAYLTRSTTGGIYGHPGAATCYATAAADASIPYGQGRAFQSSDVTETFSSDGPHRVFFTTLGAEITPGNRSSTGGIVRQKPDLTGSDGVSTYPAGGFTPFYGTSAAAPHDAAIAGLVLSANPYLKGQSTSMFSLLTSSGIPIDTAYGALPNRDAGYGILDAYIAVGRAVAAATPTATAQSITVTQGTPTPVTLAGSDPNSRALTYTVVTSPTNGTLSGTAPNLTYTPNVGYSGPDNFMFTVSNGTYTSPPATVSLSVIQAVAQDVTAQVTITSGDLRYRSGTTFAQFLTLTNNTQAPIPGPLTLALDFLSRNARLLNATGATAVTSPAGSPTVVVSADGLAVGQSILVNLSFSDANYQHINFAPRVLSGNGN